MRKRDVVIQAVTHHRPPYVPWDVAYSPTAWRQLGEQVGRANVEQYAGNHFVYINSTVGAFEDVGGQLTDFGRPASSEKGAGSEADGRHRMPVSCPPTTRLWDGFGATWRRGDDGLAGMIEGQVLPEPTLAGYCFPDARDQRHYTHIPELIELHRERFKIFAIGFTLLERAWTLRGMEPLMIDMIERPEFVEELLDAITEVNLAQIEMALRYDFDCVHLGDDWGQQRGLLIGRPLWRRLIFPRFKRMCDAVRRAGKFVSIHSCGRIDELFEDLVEMGVNIVNPFQPECMDVLGLMRSYAGRLAFHGGLSTQRTLPGKSLDAIQQQTQRLLEAGSAGGYVFAPAHGVGEDVRVENVQAMLEVLRAQPGFPRGQA